MFEKIQIVLANPVYPFTKFAVELAHIIGFESVSMEFPLVVRAMPGGPGVLSFVPEAAAEGFSVQRAGNAVRVAIAPEDGAIYGAAAFILGAADK